MALEMLTGSHGSRGTDSNNTYGCCPPKGYLANGIPQIFYRGIFVVCSIPPIYLFINIMECIISQFIFCDADGVYHFADIILVIVCGNNDGIAVFPMALMVSGWAEVVMATRYP